MSSMSKCPIGIFDSGLGGLTVLKEIGKILPNEDLTYLGDTAHVPYGGKSKSTIVRFSTENALFLLKKKVKVIVVACNTASSLALDYLKTVFSVPIIGVVESGVKKAVSVSKNKKIGVIGTKSTISSLSYQKALFRLDKRVVSITKACPLFVPLVEEGLFDGLVVDEIVKMYLKDFKGNIDTLILGCTHYPLLKEVIGKYLKDVYLVNSAREVALTVKNILKQENILNKLSRKGVYDFYLTDEAKEFIKYAKIFLQRSMIRPKVVSI